jgi:hypothetical protein
MLREYLVVAAWVACRFRKGSRRFGICSPEVQPGSAPGAVLCGITSKEHPGII